MSYVAFQYAEALFSLSREEHQLTEVEQAYRQFLDGLDKDIMKFLNHPKITRQSKKDVLAEAVNQTVFKHFLYVLLDNARIDLLEDCYEEFTTIINDQNKSMKVVVYSQQEMTTTELDKLQHNIGKKHNRKVSISNVVDRSILGGIRIEYEGHVLDQTINHYLHALKSDLSK
jgi:F-type H+-transporting ATPase subunit delta